MPSCAVKGCKSYDTKVKKKYGISYHRSKSRSSTFRPTCPQRYADLAHRPNRSDLWRFTIKSDDEGTDVIDLGAPRAVRETQDLGPVSLRASRLYTPSARLYPGPKPVQVKQKRKPSRKRIKRNVFRRPVPNSRLYRPAPPRPPPPPAYPRTAWYPSAQGQLETASNAALNLSKGIWSLPSHSQEQEVVPVKASAVVPRAKTAAAPPAAKTTAAAPKVKTRIVPKVARSHRPRVEPTSTVRERRVEPIANPVSERYLSPNPKLVITLPAASGDGSSGLRYRPTSQHFRDRELGSSSGSTPTGGRVIQLSARGTMDGSRHSTSPDDCEDGNDSHSAPSEYLAEFLSAIMRRQYAEALKYCRLILQYEPRNATARGFYPLLQQKVAQNSPRNTSRSPTPRTRRPRSRASGSFDLGGTSSTNSGESSPVFTCLLPNEEVMEQEADSLCSEERPGSAGSSEPQEPGLGSVSSQSSLELDSDPSLSLSRRTDSASASGTWDSSGSARDDNGNLAPAHAGTTHASYACDEENNRPASPAPAPPPPHAPHTPPAPHRAARAPPLTLTSEQSTESLRRLRAQFTCSIK